jgi:IAA-amino acid hydrolase
MLCCAVVVLLQVIETDPVMPGEDFSFFGRKMASTMMFIGIRNETVGSVHNLHSPNFKLDENVLPIGAAVHASLAMSYLEKQQEGFEGMNKAGSCKDEL